MITKIKNFFWPIKDNYGNKLSYEETVAYCKSRSATAILIGIVVLSLFYFCLSVKLGQNEQAAKSEFVMINNVKITDFNYWKSGTHSHKKQTYCYVDFVLNRHQYDHMLVIGSDRDSNGLQSLTD